MDYKEYFKSKNLTSINNFYEFMLKQIKYGWVDKDGNIHEGVNDALTFSLQTPIELLNTKIGNCWDMAELERCFFENMTNLKYETYYLLYEDNNGCPSHSILVFYNNDKVYWFEPTFDEEIFYYSGIHEFDNITDLLLDLKETFIKNSILREIIPKDYNPDNFYIYKYEKPKSHINGYEMREHIDNSTLVFKKQKIFPI